MPGGWFGNPRERRSVMRVLGIDTATGGCSAALWQDGGILARRRLLTQRGQADTLMPMVRDVVNEAGCGFAGIDRIGVTVGPGAFTGLRIGLAAARGLALALDRPIVGVTTFEAIARGLDPLPGLGTDGVLAVAIDSRRGDLFVQMFGSGPGPGPSLTPRGAPAAFAPADFVAALPSGAWVAGDGLALAAEMLAGRPDLAFAGGDGVPDAAVVAALAAGRDPAQALPPTPLYLRAPDVKLPASAP